MLCSLTVIYIIIYFLISVLFLVFIYSINFLVLMPCLFADNIWVTPQAPSTRREPNTAIRCTPPSVRAVSRQPVANQNTTTSNPCQTTSRAITSITWGRLKRHCIIVRTNSRRRPIQVLIRHSRRMIR